MSSNDPSPPEKPKLNEKAIGEISVDEALQMISYLSETSILSNGDLAFLIDVVNLKELYPGRLSHLI